ncbi:MAG TPA: phosphoglucomutase/phosphomannomutase family protein [Phaeodactylibacter sp.]|nr:phosphoglucomutase/phosphomannomutase family protein [Phaeodactylibacter sp.]
MQQIKFGTDGWRAIIADDYTVTNVRRVAQATALWMKERGHDKAVIGYDCRFAGKLFAENSARVLCSHGIKVFMDPNFASTPMVSLGVVKLEAQVGIVITASHNPPAYNGFKLKSALGGPMTPSQIAEVEALIPETPADDLQDLSAFRQMNLLEEVNLEELYVEHARAHFDLERINNSFLMPAYDAMYGAGQRALPRLIPKAHLLHCEYNPSFHGQAPEPIARNLGELAEYIKTHPEINCGLANDGDADRIGMFDEKGNFVDSHRILLLLLLYKAGYQKQTGKVAITFSVTDKMKRLAEHFGLPYEVTPIGFKYTAEIMAREKVLVGGEESGGIAVAGHIPERDGIWIGLELFNFMAETGKTLTQLLQEVYAIVGDFSYDRYDLHVTEDIKQRVLDNCQKGLYTSFGAHKVGHVEDLDGFKFYFDENRWVMIRPSGTEPVLRVYAQAPTREETIEILEDVSKILKQA